ncbi:hypothetical protein B0T19DRAFT_415423 [Cercophora scortea]|uniref:Uncharacterized protein n=1 Tax=Cercophora scortea TaxID=314031 RepID=A0AAE0IW33_9PEZI|nr:hypothetical protein B0T19DRAFT_415423 [Cercophora scortea]
MVCLYLGCLYLLGLLAWPILWDVNTTFCYTTTFYTPSWPSHMITGESCLLLITPLHVVGSVARGLLSAPVGLRLSRSLAPDH